MTFMAQIDDKKKTLSFMNILGSAVFTDRDIFIL